MEFVEKIEDLEALYGPPGSAALNKVARRMTPLYRDWIGRSRFCILSTVGEGGTDGSLCGA